MSQIAQNTIRVAVDNITKRDGPLSDKLTGKDLTMYQAEAAQVQLGIYSNAVKVSDLTNLASVTMLVKDPTNLLGSALLSKTQSTVVAVSDANWQNDSAQDAVFTLSATDTNIALNGASKKSLQLVFFATTTAGSLRIPLSRGTIWLLDSNYGDLGAITVQPPGARMNSNRLQVLNQTDSLYYDLVFRTVNGVVTTSIEGTGIP